MTALAGSVGVVALKPLSLHTFVSMCWPCDELGTSPRFTLPPSPFINSTGCQTAGVADLTVASQSAFLALYFLPFFLFLFLFLCVFDFFVCYVCHLFIHFYCNSMSQTLQVVCKVWVNQPYGLMQIPRRNNQMVNNG